MRSLKLAGAVALGLILAGLVSQVASAATISYGSFGPVPPGVMFTDVEESSATDPVPLFGPPTVFSVGLDFDPAEFVATASGGDEDVTDGQLNFTIMSSIGIVGVNLFEAGDYTLSGVGTVATQALAGAILRATVTQINGVDVAPINLAPSNASVGFNLIANSGVVQPWSLGTSLNVQGQLGQNQRATKVEVVIDNQLLALSEAASLAFIAKKDFQIIVNTIPEPNSVALAGLALCALGTILARKRG